MLYEISIKGIHTTRSAPRPARKNMLIAKWPKIGKKIAIAPIDASFEFLVINPTKISNITENREIYPITLM
jgi:hypothetical protein